MLKNCCRRRHLLFFALVGLLGLSMLRRKRKSPNQSRSRQSIAWRLFNTAFTKLNRRIAWHRLQPLVGVLNLLAFRNLLREHNLHDTSDLMSRQSSGKCPPQDLVTRRSDGKCNDLDYPDIGAAGERFGRNVPGNIHIRNLSLDCLSLARAR